MLTQPRSYRKQKRQLLWLFFSFLIALAIFGLLVIEDLNGPLIGTGDTEHWEYTGFYFSQNLSLWPIPHLNLVNDQVFYPYGTNHVFNHWGIERDLFYSFLSAVFGLGPWLQTYFLISLSITFWGSILLLRREYGIVRSAIFAFCVSFLNFYIVNKYPVHLSFSVVHWTVLGVICDFLIFKRIAIRETPSLRLLLLRLCLLVLALGQEVGYVAGLSLASFSTTSIFTLGLFAYRFIRNNLSLKSGISRLLKRYISECKENRLVVFLLVSLFLAGTWLLVPLVGQVAINAKSFDFSELARGSWWTNPVRLLLPYFAFLGIDNSPPFEMVPGFLTSFIKDTAESGFDSRPGLFFVLAGLLGLWQCRKKAIIFASLLTLFLLCLLYRPEGFATLQVFPWFSFSRVAGRVTVIYPVIFSILALHIQFHSRFQRRAVFLFLLPLLIIETWSIFVYWQRVPSYLIPVDESFYTYMEYVQEQPGEAVLDWPFCITGGNAVGALDGLCPFYTKTNSVHALRRFHHKKVVGEYFGRVHPSQIENHLAAGWHHLFSPDSPDFFKASQQTRCFNTSEWEFFEQFFTLNDFAGINLYSDLMPATCVQEFHARFGKPKIETVVPAAGKVQFIAKPESLVGQVDLEKGRALQFAPTLDGAATADLLAADLLIDAASHGVQIEGLSTLEDAGFPFRWALGPQTQIRFDLQEARPLKLLLGFSSPIENQKVSVYFNGELVDEIANLQVNSPSQLNWLVEGKPGTNEFVLKYQDWNHGAASFAPEDPRLMAILVTQLQLTEP